MNWKTIKGFSNYEISDEGEVRNKTTQYILKGRLSKSGYYQVSIKEDETEKVIGEFKPREPQKEGVTIKLLTVKVLKNITLCQAA